MKMTILTSLLLLMTVVSCNTTDPIPPDDTKPTLTLAIDDASCTEVWLELKTKDLEFPAELTLKQYNPSGDSLFKSFLLNTQDSLLYVDSLLPNQNYSFQVSSIEKQVSSIKQPVTTMDTTSHNFTFQSWTFGTIGSSTLYDVAIINENNIWAVGEIMIADTSQNGYTTYNAVHWDGSEWTLHKLYFYTIPGQQDTGVYAAKSILAFDENNIWITSGSQITKWNGIRQTNKHSSPVYVNKLWGTDNNNIYAVGYNGQIAHYNGTNWQRIESGTTLNINDIWGDFNEKTQVWEILAACGNILHGLENERAIIKIHNINRVSMLNSTGAIWPLNGVWFSVSKRYYVNGSGIYYTHKLGENWIGKPLEITQFFIRKIRGNDINDVFASGDYGETLHFNGNSWKSFFNETFLSNGTYLSVNLKNNLVITVGYQSAKAVITIGNR
jgi:hypothetical protein